MSRVTGRSEPHGQLHVWLPKSLLDWIQGEDDRRGLARSAYVRSHFTAMKARAEETKP